MVGYQVPSLSNWRLSSLTRKVYISAAAAICLTYGKIKHQGAPPVRIIATIAVRKRHRKMQRFGGCGISAKPAGCTPKD